MTIEGGVKGSIRKSRQRGDIMVPRLYLIHFGFAVTLALTRPSCRPSPSPAVSMTAKSGAVANRTQPVRKHNSRANRRTRNERISPFGVAGPAELQYVVMGGDTADGPLRVELRWPRSIREMTNKKSLFRSQYECEKRVFFISSWRSSVV